MKKDRNVEILQTWVIMQTEHQLNEMYGSLDQLVGDDYFQAVIDLLKLMAQLDGTSFEDKVKDYLRTLTLEVEDIILKIEEYEKK